MASGDAMKALTLGQLLSGIVTLDPALVELPITGLTIDSRCVKPGNLFIAVQGLQSHGKSYIAAAATKGAVAVLLDAAEVAEESVLPIICLTDLDSRISAIAGRFYGNPSQRLPVIGITGTNGKTTCTQLLAQALAKIQPPCGVIGTLGYGCVNRQPVDLVNTGMTTPDAITTQAICAQLVDDGANHITMEVSSHALAQHRVAALDINTAVFTNLSHDHLDYHGTMAAYGAAKARLFAMSSVTAAVINQDDHYASTLIENLNEDCHLISYGLNQNQALFAEASAYFSFQQIKLDQHGVTAKLITPEGSFVVTTRLLGRFNLSNLLAVIASLYANKIPIEQIVQIVTELMPVPGRMELVPNTLGFQVVVDYAHTPDALENALIALAAHTQGDLWCVFGCGGDRDRDKRPAMARVAEKLADRIIVTSDNPRRESSVQIFADIEKGFSVAREVIADRGSAIDYALTEARAGDVVLIAGKGHEDYQLIGDQRFPFSDQQQARLCLRGREAEEAVDD